MHVVSLAQVWHLDGAQSCLELGQGAADVLLEVGLGEEAEHVQGRHVAVLAGTGGPTPAERAREVVDLSPAIVLGHGPLHARFVM